MWLSNGHRQRFALAAFLFAWGGFAGTAVAQTAVAADGARADGEVLEPRGLDLGLVLVVTDEAAGRAVVRLEDGTLRVIEPGDAWHDGRGKVEAVTADKLVARFRLRAPSKARQAGASAAGGGWHRVWIYRSRPGENGSRVQVLRRQEPSESQGLPTAVEGVSVRVEQEVEGEDGA